MAMSNVQVIPYLIHHVTIVFVSIDSFVLIITVPSLRWLTQRRYSMVSLPLPRSSTAFRCTRAILVHKRGELSG
ncbi:hypothetical protein ARMSODRAFT_117549 [Armillaria solidipes]|uniref:Uncharacterized protein n=1 Tax=Armillaria solidipes TaxID=1076256 RepID=A0A2H3AP66_9AGAR|nr:hypothetical protein ARMSODRAFT_117549 [Armillaria solidipes]